MESNWEWDDPEIPDEEVLYRKVRKIPDHRTWDPELRRYYPTAAALRRKKNEGMSTHANSVLLMRGRQPDSLYEPSKYDAVGFAVRVVREPDIIGIIFTPAGELEEADPDLRAAHAEVRPKNPDKDRVTWSKVVDRIIDQSSWIEQRGLPAR